MDLEIFERREVPPEKNYPLSTRRATVDKKWVEWIEKRDAGHGVVEENFDVRGGSGRNMILGQFEERIGGR